MNWMKDANCRGVDPEIFFPNDAQSAAPAKMICKQCDVWEQCLNHALDMGFWLDGVWGGTTRRERWKTLMRANRRKGDRSSLAAPRH